MSRLDQHLEALGTIYAPEDDSVYLLTRHTQVGELIDEVACGTPKPAAGRAPPKSFENKRARGSGSADVLR